MMSRDGGDQAEAATVEGHPWLGCDLVKPLNRAFAPTEYTISDH
jgi:hypothetical protein